MKRVLSLVSFVSLLTSMPPVGPIALNAESRFSDVRRMVRTGGGRVEELKGTLISDPETGQVRFEGSNPPFFAAAYDRIATMHFETDTKRPQALLNKQIGYYLTFHYWDAGGQARFATFRLSKPDVQLVLDSLQRDTGLPVNSTPSKRSFLGLPIRVAVGDTVVVTDDACRTTTGKITHLSAVSLVVNGSTPSERQFDVGSIRKITLAYPEARDTRSRLKWWAGIGAIVGAVYGGALSGVAGVMEGAVVFGALWSAIGTGVHGSGAAADSDVYLGVP